MQPVVVVLLAAVAMIVIEQLAPGVRLPKVKGWIPRLTLLNGAQVAIVYLGAATWDRWLPQWRWFDASVSPDSLGVALGYFAITFVFYWWHRARHEVPWLWDHLHQVHHSPERIECAMSFYKHPVEIVLNSLLCSILLYVLLCSILLYVFIGLSAPQTGVVMMIAGVAELIYHWNVRTPRWLGYLFQRPEMHRRHHERDWHRSNYSGDLTFGGQRGGAHGSVPRSSFPYSKAIFMPTGARVLRRTDRRGVIAR